MIYRFAPLAVRQAKMELRAEALLDVPKELPIDHLAFQLNPDRRDLPEAREYAAGALAALPDSATVFSPSRMSELMVAPLRYLVEVESRANVRFSTQRDELVGSYVLGLHPANADVSAGLDTYHFRASGEWFHVVARDAVTDVVMADGYLADSDADPDALDDSHLMGRWYGYVEPQGYPLTLWVQGAPGNLSGTATIGERGRARGRMSKDVSFVSARRWVPCSASVEFGERGHGSSPRPYRRDPNRATASKVSWKDVRAARARRERFIVWLQP